MEFTFIIQAVFSICKKMEKRFCVMVENIARGFCSPKAIGIKVDSPLFSAKGDPSFLGKFCPVFGKFCLALGVLFLGPLVLWCFAFDPGSLP
jgi:hypothetical protein